jgi:outer membrane lipoprotein-sorting protein/protocatechuate 3,4-dioxygenase beta subunit
MDPKPKTILRQLKQLSQIAPTNEAAERALAGARATLSSLAAKPVPARLSDRKDLSLRSKPMFSHAAKLALIGVVLVAILAAYTLTGGRRQLAFAEVAEKVQKTQSLSFKVKQIPPVPEEPEERILILPDGRARADGSKGYWIRDDKGHKMIMVDNAHKTAQVQEGFSLPVPGDVNVYEMIKNIRKEAVRRLPDEEIGGRKVAVFGVEIKRLPAPEKSWVSKVWVDPKTELPIRIETPEQDLGERGRNAATAMYDIEFDRPFDPALFSFEPPKGYTVQTSGTANFPDLPDKADLRAPRIIPGVGMGPIRFGMSREKIESLLGKPDGYDADKTGLLYFSRGYVLTVSHRSGLKTINCVSQMLSLNKVRDFAGKTVEGVGIGSSLKEVEKAFGKPDRDAGVDAMNKRLVYDKLGLEIQFVEDKVINILMQEIPTRLGAATSGANKPTEKTPAADLRTMQIDVVGPDGKPMPGAKIHVAIWERNPAKKDRDYSDYVSDARGLAVIRFPQDFKILRFWVVRDGYAPLFVHWEELDAAPPQVFAVRLAKGTVIGGTVQDEQGRPIAGAKVEVSVVNDQVNYVQQRIYTAGGLANGDDARTTDAAGRWTLDNVPDGDVKLSLRASHPGYRDYASWDAVHQKESSSLPLLRSQKATIVLPQTK